MLTSAKIYVAGHTGLAGSAILRRLRESGYDNFALRPHRELELMDKTAVDEFFRRERPEYVFVAAAKVGGILAHAKEPVDFLLSNVEVQNNVLCAARDVGVKRLLLLGSSCIYPRECPQPIREEYLLSSALEPTNRPYALAKILGVELCWAMNRQFGTRYLAAMPTNLYGPGDNYDLRTSHVIPALLRKMHDAKEARARTVTIWGTGKPRREFLHSADMADAAVFLMNLPDADFLPLLASQEVPPIINIGYGSDITIAEVAHMVAEIAGFTGELVFDPSKPDGTPRKLLDVSKMEKLGWHATISLREGLTQTYREFVEKGTAVRG